MLHRWMGRKSLQRNSNVLGTQGRERGKPIGMDTVDITHGQVFEPTEQELVSFRDLLEPVGASLHVTDERLSGATGEGVDAT